MPDQRSVMKEFRFLDQKRLAEGLTSDEEARHGQLRDLIGPESGAGGSRPGFDVNAAAARLRESLLPAGLRNRAVPPPAPAPEPIPEVQAFEQATDPVGAAWAEQPFAALDPASGGVADPYFDPATLDGPSEAGTYGLGTDAAAYEDPNAAGHDPHAGYDPSSAAYDPGTPPYDPNAAWAPDGVDRSAVWADPALDPNALAYDPGAAWAADPALDPNAPAYDPNAPVDPNAPPYDPGAAWAADPALDPNAAAYDPNAWAAEPALDPNAPLFDPNTPVDPNAPYDPSTGWAADPALDPAAAGDPNAAWAHEAESLATGNELAGTLSDDVGTSDDGATVAPPDAAAESPAWDPHASWPAETATDGELEPGVEIVDLAASATEDLDGSWETQVDADGLAPENPGDPLVPGEAPADAFPPPAEGEPSYDAASDWAAAAPAADDQAAWDAVGDPAPAPGDLGDGGWGAEPPVVERAAAALSDGPAEGWDPTPPAPASVRLPPGEYDETAVGPAHAATLEPELAFDPAPDAALEPSEPPPGFAPVIGEYDDSACFAAPIEPPPEDLPLDAPGFRAGAPMPAEGEWQPETALDQGFELASGGSFDAAADAVAPEWARGGVLPPWEAPAEDVSERFSAGDAGTLAIDPDAGPLDLSDPVEGDAIVEGDLAGPDPHARAAEALQAAPAPELDFSAPELSAPSEDGFDSFEPAPAPELALAPSLEDRATVLGETPPLDLGGVELGEEVPAASPEPPALEDSRVPEASAVAPEVELLDDIPTIDGEEILEEITLDDAGPPPALDFEPLPIPPVEPAAAEPARAGEPIPAAAPEPVAELAARERDPAAGPPPAIRPASEPPPEPEPLEPDALPEPPATSRVDGSHRVVIHTVEGLVKRGVLEDADLAASALGLAPQPGGAQEVIPTDKVKAIFFMLSPGERAPAAEGKKVRVTFLDGRQVAGFSPDYQDGRLGFFMIPADTRTNTGRIWVYQAAVRQVAVS
jgi:hypothetical protein